MSSSESNNEQSVKGPKDLPIANLLNRVIARIIDFLIVLALFEIIPKVGFFAGIAYLMIADGLFKGRSIGKRLVGLRVVYIDAFDSVNACGFKESIIRNIPFAAGIVLYRILGVVPLLGWLLSYAVLIGIVLFESLVMMGSENGMRVGDELAQTLVIEDEHGRIDV